jgi:hypothetical protein
MEKQILHTLSIQWSLQWNGDSAVWTVSGVMMIGDTIQGEPFCTTDFIEKHEAEAFLSRLTG